MLYNYSMKTLLLLHSDLLESGREKFYRELEENLEVLKKVIGVDSLYASVSSHFRDIFDRFPEVCLINSLRDGSVFAAYRGLRKLRGDDVLLLDGGLKVTRELLHRFFGKIHVTVGTVRDRWAGIALVKMRDLNYVIKSMERNFENTILDAFYTLRDTYSVATEFIQLRDAPDLQTAESKPLYGGSTG